MKLKSLKRLKRLNLPWSTSPTSHRRVAGGDSGAGRARHWPGVALQSGNPGVDNQPEDKIDPTTIRGADIGIHLNQLTAACDSAAPYAAAASALSVSRRQALLLLAATRNTIRRLGRRMAKRTPFEPSRGRGQAHVPG